MNDGYDELDNMVTLQDEAGVDQALEFLDLIELDGREYVVLLPICADGEEETGEVVILRVEPTDIDADEETYVSVDDEVTLLTIFEVFKDKHKGEFNFED